jgi:hypothetical protein
MGRRRVGRRLKYEKVVAMPDELNFQKIVTRFISNIYALRVFNIEIGDLAEQHDEKVVDSILDNLAENLGIDRDVLKVRIKEKDSKSGEEKNDDVDHLEEELKKSGRDKTRKKLDEIETKNPGFIMGLYKSLMFLRKKIPKAKFFIKTGRFNKLDDLF